MSSIQGIYAGGGEDVYVGSCSFKKIQNKGGISLTTFCRIFSFIKIFS
ncbi:MAG: hypothetical protein ACE5NG_10585 [bacterium]